jgi:hypothetical protein
MAASTETPDADAPRRQRLARTARAVVPLADATGPADAPGLSTALALVRATAFWASICLPAVHLPLLLVEGLTPTTIPVLVTLWTLHALVLAVGASHDPDDERRSRVSAPADD